MGGGVSAPRTLYSPDPEYTEQAGRSKFQPIVVLWLIVDLEGKPPDLRVMRSVGMGSDEKAIEAVRTWRFAPARKDGQPAAVQINVEASFRLY